MNCPTSLERMKSRNFYMVLLLIVVSTVSLWFLTSYPTQSFRTIVSKTHTGIKNLPSNINNNIKAKELTVDPLYLTRLGLSNSKINDDFIHGENQAEEATPKSKIPIIATAAKPNLLEETTVLLRSVHKLQTDVRVIVYDLGLSTSEKTKLNKYCNNSWNCEVQAFQFDKYPSHVSNLDIRSYRPVCIQEMLKAYGMVIWVDSGHYFQGRNLTSVLARAQDSGIQAWPIQDPTSSFTHLKMFKFFNMDQNSYFFQHAVESSHLVIYNTARVRNDIMLPWIKCALQEECINPTGAQNSGCIDFRKPLFKYRGCHKYDMSALNIILGKAFNFDEVPYSADEKRLFGSLIDDKLRAENRTRTMHEISVGIGQQIKI